MAASDVLAMLGSHLKLDREKGVRLIETSLSDSGEQYKIELCRQLIASLSEEDDTRPWESKHGAFMGLAVVLPRLPQHPNAVKDDELLITIKNLALKHLSDVEVRVRLAAGDILGTLCKHCGPLVYVDCKDFISEMIRTNLERQTIDDGAAAQAEQEETERLIEKFSTSVESRRMSAEEIFHDTAGWKSLETSMKALQAMIDGCGGQFLPFINQELLDLIFESLTHTNRFVRETGFYVCSSLVNCGLHKSKDSGDFDAGHEDIAAEDCNPLFEYGHQFSKYLGLGMSDNWSQVRLASSVATRKFLLAFPDSASRELFFPQLLPKMCLNRYYLADGVRLYSQETWRLVAENSGRQLVQKYIKDVVDFYVKQTQANNHAVREASCSCIAELAAKITRDAVLPYIGHLLATLLVCFEDDSWPVRDAACLACGNFIVCFPEDCRSSLDKLFPLFFMNLEDNITSVRQGGAAALANVVKAYGAPVLDVVINRLETGLRGVDNQESESEKYANVDKSPATFGVVKRLRDNDMDLHTDQTVNKFVDLRMFPNTRSMYSCGSLAPKMGRGRLGGCLDRTFRRPPQPWELTDGCIYLMSELSLVPCASPQVALLLPSLVDACSRRHYTHHVNLLETMCKQLPVMAKGVGKRLFKPFVESFFEPVFYALSCENVVTSTAASQCLIDLCQLLGHGILRGRLEQFNPNLLPQFDSNIASSIVY